MRITKATLAAIPNTPTTIIEDTLYYLNHNPSKLTTNQQAYVAQATTVYMERQEHRYVRNSAIIRAKRALKVSHGVNKLLTNPESNPKLAKNGVYSGIMTSPLHLSPAKISGYEVCPKASKGCREACLHTAGNPIYMDAKHTARLNRTRAFFEARSNFMTMLVGEIAALERKAHKAGQWAGVRLNATSDLTWFNTPVTFNGWKFANIMELFPLVTFYDYTKRANVFKKKLPRNYSFTFSLSEENEQDAFKVLENGGTVATVFGDATTRIKALPSVFTVNNKKFDVVDGDLTDYRPDDPKGVIVGLKAKGKAFVDQTGFVQYTDTYKGAAE